VPQLGFLVLVSLLNFGLGALVYSRNTSHWVNRSFALFAFSIAGWSITQVSRLAGSEPALFWARLAFVMAGLSMFAMVLFFQMFPFRNTLPTSWPLRIFGASACAFMLFSMLSPWIVSSATRTATGRTLTYGPLYDTFAVYVLCCGGYSVLTIIRKTRAARGAEREQLKYLFVALLVPGAFAIITNLVVPLITGSSALSQYGPLFSVVMIAMIAHAIIRHRLMDVQLVIRQGAVYVCAIVTAALMFFVLVEIFHQAMRRESENIPLFEALAFAVIVAIVFQPLKGWINTSFNRYLYRHTYDYQQTLREASRTLSTTLTLEPLIDYLAALIEQTFQVEFVAVYVLDQPGRTVARHFYHATPGYKARRPPPSLAGHSAILRYLSDERKPLVREEAARRSTHHSIVTAAEELASLGGDVAIPLLRDRSLAGLIAIGAKRSGDPFFGQDLDLLSTLTGQAAVAMQNAQLYQQVVLANEYVENILRTMDSGVVTVDAAGKVALCNSTAARLTGLSRDRLSTLDVDSLPLALGSQLRETLSDGHPRSQAETTLPNEGDRRIPLVCSTTALRDERGAVIGALIVFSDLSKIKALESEKRRAERLASFGSLVSGIAHEIKNPLVAIKTFAELLPERFSDIDFRDDFSKVVKAEIDRIDGLVGRLRSLATPTPDAVAATDIRDPISDTLTLLRGQFEQTQTMVHRDLGESQALVTIDPAQVKQLFLNLLLNAVESMTLGGQLSVAIVRLQRQGQSWVQVAVTDTGPGIPDAIRSKIFEPFFTTKARGSGLGLAICRSIADAHKGTITVEKASEGSGTTILVEFPAASTSSLIEEKSALLR
jgi:PAS domain S-box-containing protein